MNMSYARGCRLGAGGRPSRRVTEGPVGMQLGLGAAFLFMTREPGWGRKLLVVGALLLACPPLGWPLALGYRREVALRLVRGREPVLPGWDGAWRTYLADGLGAAGVILAHYLPFLGLFWMLAL